MIHDESVALLEELADYGYHTTVETNGTIYRDGPIDLANISPKPASSTPTAERDPKGDGEWAERHERDRIDGSIFDSCSGYCDNGEAAETTLPSVAIENGQVYLTDDDARFLHDGPSDDDGDDMPDSTSHLQL